MCVKLVIYWNYTEMHGHQNINFFKFIVLLRYLTVNCHIYRTPSLTLVTHHSHHILCSKDDIDREV